MRRDTQYPDFPGVLVKWRKRGRNYSRLFKTINGASNFCDVLEQDKRVKDIEIGLPPVRNTDNEKKAS